VSLIEHLPEKWNDRYGGTVEERHPVDEEEQNR